MHLARSWLEQRLAEQGLSIEQLVHLESQNQAADQVSVSHTITSLRFLGATDWREFVEDLSVVDQTLHTDHVGYDLIDKGQAVQERLIHPEAGLIQLLDPPFDHSHLNPGYIKGYIPGVRENGGQYTHAAIWTAMAFARLGENEQAWELFALLNPIHHSATPTQIATYKVEPYALAADVYALAPHQGRGGWTWYTGSAGWMCRLLIETLLGLNLEGDQLRLTPRLRKTWTTFATLSLNAVLAAME